MSDDVFDQVTALLPAESPVARATPSNTASPAPPTPASAPQSPPVQAMANMGLHNNQHQHQPPPQRQTPQQQQQPHQPPSQNPTPAPPAYNQTGPPSLPARGGGPPAAPPPSKPVLAHARALYRYQAADERDLSFEREDRIAVHEYMNADWWMGRNERTGAEGIFPKNYVHVDQDYKQQQPKQQPTYGGPPPQQYQPPYANPGYPPPPGQNPYNAHVPPMAVAQGGDGGGGGGAGAAQGSGAQEGGSEGGNSKINEHGKKFGKKLGNAAIFGAGATMGSNLVNSIF